jgi:hypothetical protein
LMLVMRDLLARRSEAAALTVEHLTFAKDGSAKTDQEGAGAVRWPTKKAPRAQKKSPCNRGFLRNHPPTRGRTVPTPGTRSIWHVPTYVWNEHKFLE